MLLTLILAAQRPLDLLSMDPQMPSWVVFDSGFQTLAAAPKVLGLSDSDLLFHVRFSTWNSFTFSRHQMDTNLVLKTWIKDTSSSDPLCTFVSYSLSEECCTSFSIASL